MAWGILTSFLRRLRKAFAKFGSYPDDSPPNGSIVNVSDDASMDQYAEIKSKANTMNGRNIYGDAPDKQLLVNILKSEIMKILNIITEHIFLLVV